MKNTLLTFLAVAFAAGFAFAQTTILDFQAPPTSTTFQYFGSSLEGTLNQVVANPAVGGINTSTLVSQFIKPAGAQTWAGAFSNPNPTTAITVTGGALIKIKVRMNHIGNLAVKLEQSTSGQADWIKIVANTQVDEWQELTFNTALPSDEAPNQIPTGTFNRLVLFFDFGIAGGGADVTSHFDDVIVSGGTPPPADFPVDFAVDMGDYTGSFTTVYVSGTMNGWSGNANPLSDPDGDDIWTGTLNLAAGSYEYKFTLDNWAQQESFAPGGSCTITTGGFTNRALTVASAITLPEYCWNSCSVCGTPTPMVNFSVDMGNFTGSFTTVYISGTMNGWSGNANPLSDPDGDDIWTVSLPLADGFYEYKFTIDNWAQQEQFSPGGSCTITTGGFTNRALTVAGNMTLPEYCWNSCNVCTVPTSMVNFSVDMGNFTGTFTTVYISGTMNGWSGDANPLSDPDGDDIWTVSLPLTPGFYEYKFTLDNWAQQEQFAVGGGCTITTGGFTNRALTVAGNMTLLEYCWNSCAVCGIPDPLVSFSVDMSDFAGTFTTVYVSGIFNSWSGNANPLSDPNGDDIWTGTVSMPAGFYEYKVTLDNWAQQENFLGTEECTMTTGPFTNRKLTVPAGGNMTVPQFCYNSCYLCGEEVKMTFKLGMGSVVPNPAGVWLAGGGNFEDPGGRYRMNDNNNDGIWEIVVPRHTGFSSYFTFANGPCGDYSCKENIAGLPCANPNNFNDRFLPPVNNDLIFASCFAQCCDNAQCTYPALTANFTTTHVLCNGGNNGAIATSVTGGSTIHTFNWGGGITTANRSNLTAGSYVVTITDAIAQQSVVYTVVVNQPALMVPTAAVTQVSCFGLANGTIQLSTTGGVAPFSYNWGGGITGPNRNNLAPGTYTATVTDGNLCTKTISTTITQPNVLAATSTTVNVDCFSNATGSITLAPTGGTTAYSYLWNDGPTTQNRTALTAGTYTVTVTDAKGCTTVHSKTIGQPNLLATTAATIDIDCFGNNNGSITTTTVGGTTAYNFLWENGATTPNRTGLFAGTYSATVTDAKNCTTTISKTITEPAAPLETFVVGVDVDCFGSATGTVLLVPSGGTADYSYQWAGSTSTEDSRYDLPAGTYSATVTDENGCTNTISQTIAQPSSALSLTATSVEPACGNANGSISLTVSGGTASYSFNWGGGITSQNRTGLLAGTYTVTVYDANACSSILTKTLTDSGSSLAVSASSTNVACFGNANGAINLSIGNGTAPFSFFWENGATTQNRTGLSGGIYSVTVTDGNDCTSVFSKSITEPAAALATTATSTDIACFGKETGAIQLAPTGGTAPFSFNWGNGITSQNRTDLAAGTYSATISDANGCETTVSSNVTQPNAALAASATSSNVDCFGNATGSILLGVSGGTAGYSFDWGGGIVSQNRSNLTAGNYSATVTDANGCTTFIEKTITEPAAALIATATSTDVLCNGAASGTASTLVTGGNGGFSYSWTTGATTSTLGNLAAGTYSVTVSDSENCVSTASVTISQPDLFACSATATAQSANNLNDGTATATPNGGTTPYIYEWSNGATTQTLSNLAPGAYSVTTTDANGCTAAQTVTVNAFGCNVSATILGVNVTCFGENNGSATVNLAGATDPVSYIWSNGNTTPTVSGLTPGSYSVEILDANGCPASLSAQVSEPAQLGANASATGPTTNDQNDGSASASPTGGTAPFSFEWSNGANSQTINGLSPNTYSVVVTDANGCTAAQSVLVAPFGCALSASFSTQNVTCAGAANGEIALDLTGGNGPFTYLWSNGQTTATATGLSGGAYSVIVSDAAGCDASVSATITEPTALNAAISAQVNTTCLDEASGSATVDAQGGTAPLTFLWANGETTATTSNLLPGNYPVVITDANGCTTTTSATIAANDNVPPIVTCVGNITRCADQATVTYQFPFATDNCSIANGTWDLTTGLNSGSVFPTGVTTQTFTFTDAAGNTGSCSFDVKILTPASVGNFAAAGCFQNCEGSITASGTTGGEAPYIYQWSNGQTGATASALCNGDISLMVVDNAGCSTAQTFNLALPTALVVAAPVVVNDMNSQNSGSITITVSGGTAPFSFNWTKNGNPFATTKDIGNLGFGNYTVVVTDANGCEISVQNIVVTNIVGASEPAWANGLSILPNPTTGQVQILFAQILTGEIEVSVLDATGRVAAKMVSTNGQTIDLDLSNLPEGIYVVRLRSANEVGSRILAIQK